MRSFPSSRLGSVGVALAVSLAFSCAVIAQRPATKPATAKPAASADPIVIAVGTEHIRASQFNELIKAAPAENQAEMLANKRAVADELGKMLALVQEAHRQGLDQNPAFQAQMLLARDNALAKSVVDKLQTSATPTEAQIKTYYDAHPADFSQTKLRHILVGDSETPGGPNPRTQAEALTKVTAVAARLKAGGDFAAIAKTDSDDPGSKDKGGDLGVMTPGQTVPEFEAAVNALPVGKVSDPIHTRFGYHIVQVEARTTMPYDQAKPLIEEQLSSQTVDAAIDRIAANAHVVISNSYFGPAKPAVPPTPHP